MELGKNRTTFFCVAAGTDLTASPHQSWSNLNRRKLTVIVNTDLTPGDGRKKAREAINTCTSYSVEILHRYLF